jgi:hypothetical protein
MGIFRSEMLISFWFYQFHFRCESRALKTLEWSESTVGEQPVILLETDLAGRTPSWLADGTGFHPDGMDTFQGGMTGTVH